MKKNRKNFNEISSNQNEFSIEEWKWKIHRWISKSLKEECYRGL